MWEAEPGMAAVVAPAAVEMVNAPGYPGSPGRSDAPPWYVADVPSNETVTGFDA